MPREYCHAPAAFTHTLPPPRLIFSLLTVLIYRRLRQPPHCSPAAACHFFDTPLSLRRLSPMFIRAEYGCFIDGACRYLR